MRNRDAIDEGTHTAAGRTKPPAAVPVRVHNIDVDGARSVQAGRVYRSVGAPLARRDALLVFFHGGAFIGGGLDNADAFLRQLAGTSTAHVILAPSYTLAGVSPFPAAVEDAHAVLVWARRNKVRLGWNGKYLLVAGFEAGANLAAVCALISRDRGGPALAGEILIMPMLDPTLSSPSMRATPLTAAEVAAMDSYATGYRAYLPNASDRVHPYASPLRSSRLETLPPTLILAAEDDPLRDEAAEYAGRLIACGVKTTVGRLPRSLEARARAGQCVCPVAALDDIASFLAAIKAYPPPA